MYRWMRANYVELIVDRRIVDLNRIPLPADTPIIDKRFEEQRKETPKRSSKSAALQTPSVNPAPPAAAAGGR